MQSRPAAALFVVLTLASAGCLLAVSTDGLAGDPLGARDGGPDRPDSGTDAADVAVDATDAADASRVPDGAVVFAGNGHAYLVVVVPSSITWLQARDRAIALGGHLATVGSAAEDRFVLDLAREHPEAFRSNGTGPWLGARRTRVDGGTPDTGWAWVDGTPWSYTGWREGQPDDTDRLEDYLALYAPEGVDLGWNDDALDGTNLVYDSMIVELE